MDPLSRPREVPRSMDSSCPGLTRASIEKKRFFQGGVDCRVKLGNDGVGSEIGSKSFAVSDDPRMTDCEFLKRKSPVRQGGAKYSGRYANGGVVISRRAVFDLIPAGVVPVADSVAGR